MADFLLRLIDMSCKAMNLPKARIKNIVEQNSDGQILICDLLNNKAFNPNETHNIVFKECAGKKDLQFLETLI